MLTHFRFNLGFDALAAAAGLLALLICAGAAAPASAQTILAFGASQTYGKGVARGEDYPAQLQQMLRAQVVTAKVVNAGVNGDTTKGMLARLGRYLKPDTKLVILQPGGNDGPKGIGEAESAANVAAMRAQIEARHIPVVMVPNQMFRGYPRQQDGQHLTPEGYKGLAAALLPQVVSALK